MRRDTGGVGRAASDDWEFGVAAVALVGLLALFAGVRRGYTDAWDQALTAWF